MANKGRSRLPPGKLRKDAQEHQRRETMGNHQARVADKQHKEVQLEHTRDQRTTTATTPKPMTGSERRAERREAATKIQQAFKKFQFRKNLNKARPEIQQAMQGDLSPRLTGLVGDFYERQGLVKKGVNTVAKDAGRLTNSWSSHLSTEKDLLEENRRSGLKAVDPVHTTHHTVSDNVLGYVHAGAKAVGGAEESRFRAQVTQDSMFQRDTKTIQRQHTLKIQGKPNTHDTMVDDAQKSEIFQMRQNLTYGPDTNTIVNDPGSGFDASFKRGAHAPGLKSDWDERSTKIRPVHNLGMLLKTGQYGLTGAGVDHMTKSLQESRAAHARMMGPESLQEQRVQTTVVDNPHYDPDKPRGKANPTKIPVHTPVRASIPQNIPAHGVGSGHFAQVSAAEVRKKKFK